MPGNTCSHCTKIVSQSIGFSLLRYKSQLPHDGRAIIICVQQSNLITLYLIDFAKVEFPLCVDDGGLNGTLTHLWDDTDLLQHTERVKFAPAFHALAV